MRRWLRRLHLWLGLALGGLVALAGLTGSILAFYPELDDTLHPALASVPGDARPRSWQAVYDALRRDHPDRPGAWRIEVTPHGGAIPVRYYTPVETRGRLFAPLMLWLDPRSLATIRQGFWGDYPTTWVYALHWYLLAGRTGEWVMAAVGTGLALMLATGIGAWWPRPGQWSRALRWKRGAGRTRRLYDLHKLAGLAAAPVLLAVAATGVALELPDQLRPLIARASPLFAMPHPVTTPGIAMLPLDRLATRARAVFPDGELAWIETPAGPTGTVRVTLYRPGEPSRRFPRTQVWLDPWTGAVLAVRDGRNDSGGDLVLNWLHPIHGGEAFGLAGRIAVLLSGLAVALLAITGWWRWATRR